jgi:hypothetical protein
MVSLSEPMCECVVQRYRTIVQRSRALAFAEDQFFYFCRLSRFVSLLLRRAACLRSQWLAGGCTVFVRCGVRREATQKPAMAQPAT